MRINQNGRITIPREIRRKLGILAGTELELVISGRDLILRKIPTRQSRGGPLMSAMRGKSRTRMTTDQIMALTRGRRPPPIPFPSPVR
jgi:AbrB family looped-hinge helix DNA binding protein